MLMEWYEVERCRKLSRRQCASIVVSVLILALVGVTGCGSSGDSATAALPQATFIKRAEAICEQAEQEEFKSTVAYTKEHPSSKEEEWVAPIFVPAVEEQLRQLKALGAPEGEESSIDSMLAELGTAIEVTKADPKKVLQPSTNPFEKYDKLAKKNGLVACSHAP
jgi:hypothetical protein